MEWSRATTLKLIKLLERDECLWNSKCVSYKNKKERLVALKTAAVSMDSSVVVIERKINTIKSQYKRELVKLKQMQSKFGDPDVTSSWYAFEHLEFMKGEIESSALKASHSFDVETPVSRYYSLCLWLFLYDNVAHNFILYFRT